jgi:hypothetical protein
MATQMGVNAQEFTTLHQQQISPIRLQFGQYIKDLHRLKESSRPAPTLTPAHATPAPAPNVSPAPAPDTTLSPMPSATPAPTPNVLPAPMSIKFTPKGFPQVPDIPFENLKKEDLEDLMRNYLNMHYSTPFAPLNISR